jgi:hypothetical protein
MKTAYSLKETPEEIAQDLQTQFSIASPKAIVFFASSAFDPEAISSSMYKAFPNATVFGCSTAGEIVSGKMLKKSVVAMAFEDQIIDKINLSIIKDVKSDKAVEDAFAVFEKQVGKSMLELDPTAYVGLILVDGLSMKEEELMDKIGDLTNVTFLGGSAGDDLQFKQTHVFAAGQAYSNAAVLALLKPKIGFDIIKTQSFSASPRELLATRVDEQSRQVLEFNGKDAAAAYAEIIGASVEDAPKHFMKNPVGLIIDGEPYVRSPQQIKDNHMVFYCNVKDQMKLSILESTDIVKDTQTALAEKKAEMGKLGAILNFNCILRTLELESEGRTEDYGKIFEEVPTVGFSTYGEQCIGHVNQTATMLVFKG